MKIAIIDYYNESSSIHKDPITIPLSLASIGYDIELVTRHECNLKNLHGFKLSKLQDWLKLDLEQSSFDAVIAISRFDSKLTQALTEIKRKSIPLILKGDTDGTIGFPLKPNYLRTKSVLRNPLNILRHIKWSSRFSNAVKEKISQIKLADLVVCESPKALENLNKIFDFWLIDKEKIAFIPNPVSDICIQKDIPELKQKKIVSVGRWDDIECKGSDLLAKVIELTCEETINLHFMIVGNCPNNIKRLLPNTALKNITFTGHLTFEETQEVISTAQILLVPSRLESFSLVSAEALCWGTSLVVTPIESLQYLVDEGNFGTVAKDFKAASIKKALSDEIRVWEKGLRNPTCISHHWRQALSQNNIGEIWKKNLVSTIKKFKTNSPTG